MNIKIKQIQYFVHTEVISIVIDYTIVKFKCQKSKYWHNQLMDNQVTSVPTW